MRNYTAFLKGSTILTTVAATKAAAETAVRVLLPSNPHLDRFKSEVYGDFSAAAAMSFVKSGDDLGLLARLEREFADANPRTTTTTAVDADESVVGKRKLDEAVATDAAAAASTAKASVLAGLAGAGMDASASVEFGVGPQGHFRKLRVRNVVAATEDAAPIAFAVPNAHNLPTDDTSMMDLVTTLIGGVRVPPPSDKFVELFVACWNDVVSHMIFGNVFVDATNPANRFDIRRVNFVKQFIIDICITRIYPLVTRQQGAGTEQLWADLPERGLEHLVANEWAVLHSFAKTVLSAKLLPRRKRTEAEDMAVQRAQVYPEVFQGVDDGMTRTADAFVTAEAIAAAINPATRNPFEIIVIQTMHKRYNGDANRALDIMVEIAEGELESWAAFCKSSECTTRTQLGDLRVRTAMERIFTLSWLRGNAVIAERERDAQEEARRASGAPAPMSGSVTIGSGLLEAAIVNEWAVLQRAEIVPELTYANQRMAAFKAARDAEEEARWEAEEEARAQAEEDASVAATEVDDGEDEAEPAPFARSNTACA